MRRGAAVSAINTADGPVFGTFIVTRVGAAVSGPSYWVTVTGTRDGAREPETLSGYVFPQLADELV